MKELSCYWLNRKHITFVCKYAEVSTISQLIQCYDYRPSKQLVRKFKRDQDKPWNQPLCNHRVYFNFMQQIIPTNISSSAIIKDLTRTWTGAGGCCLDWVVYCWLEVACEVYCWLDTGWEPYCWLEVGCATYCWLEVGWEVNCWLEVGWAAYCWLEDGWAVYWLDVGWGAGFWATGRGVICWLTGLGTDFWTLKIGEIYRLIYGSISHSTLERETWIPLNLIL